MSFVLRLQYSWVQFLLFSIVIAALQLVYGAEKDSFGPLPSIFAGNTVCALDVLALSLLKDPLLLFGTSGAMYGVAIAGPALANMISR